MLRTYACHCQAGKHTVDIGLEPWVYLAQIISELGALQTVVLAETNKKYLVPRIYIAKHGLKAKEVSDLGFPEA